ncbi:DUF1800 domain-containing protein [Aquidulcibacter sp.]|uniref:DUF1800 domain-containing protein n=1 Tax=Aquidulcibacter sp. TaxID=2052990 RepID=UPI0025BC420E|nr:DUF1800 domain-containing protein [Aquidulcibacter sp.]MCA3692486.1 DUF1800 domain-containing protein [Aquidulcibacter sp.]
MSLNAVIAANRFGLGARPGELAQIARDPKAWLMSQIGNAASTNLPANGLLSSAQAFEALQGYQQARAAQQRNAQSPNPAANVDERVRLADLISKTTGPEIEARIQHAVTTPAPFAERWVQFWSNHFTMAARNLQTTPFPGSFEREAIRPHVWGRFEDLLVKADTHVGMLIYLDQAQSIGPNSQAAQNQQGRRRVAGLNENLAREILELHTLGADGGYTQADVTEFARALTGWTVAGPRVRRLAQGAEMGTTIFVSALHEPGSRTILGKNFPATGERQALDILAHLARQPSVAKRIAFKLAQHFVADDPPPALVTRLENAFLQSRGDLSALAKTLVQSPEAWTPEAQKFKTPNDFLLSTMRASGANATSTQALRSTFEQLGQTPWRAPSPKGWPDVASEWAAPDAILKRIDWANLAADVIGETFQPLAFAETALGPALTDKTKTAISRAQTARQGIVLALMSPEFQRR